MFVTTKSRTKQASYTSRQLAMRRVRGCLGLHSRGRGEVAVVDALVESVAQVSSHVRAGSEALAGSSAACRRAGESTTAQLLHNTTCHRIPCGLIKQVMELTGPGTDLEPQLKSSPIVTFPSAASLFLVSLEHVRSTSRTRRGDPAHGAVERVFGHVASLLVTSCGRRFLT